MTAAELVRTLLRRWYLVLLGALVSLGLLWTAVHQPPVYFTQLDVVLLPPGEKGAANTLREGPYSLAPLAGLVVSDVNDGVPPTQLSSATTTLYGEGVLAGDRVRLRNRGTQWQRVYDAGIIDVQVVAADPDTVRTRARELVAELDEALVARQVAVGVRPASRVSLESSPADPLIQQIGPSSSRAAGSVAMLGAIVTFLLVVLVDRLLARRRRGAPASGGDPSEPVRLPEVVLS